MKRFDCRGIILKVISLTVILILASCSCSGPGGSSQSGNHPIPIISSLITIDTVGTVPIIGNSATNTVVYIHNNTESTISGITYSVDDNNPNLSHVSTSKIFSAKQKAGITISQTSAALCSTIPAHGSCPLSFVTPAPASNSTIQGASTITASYGDNKSFSRIINYATVQNNTTNGVVVNSGVSAVSIQDVSAYSMVYIYASGFGQTYTIESLTLNKPGLIITQGNQLVGTQMASGAIQAIEVKSPILQGVGGIVASLNVRASGFNSSATVGIRSLPMPSSAILVSGLAPLVNTEESRNFVIPVNNVGNATVTSISVTYPNGVVAGPLTGNACGPTLLPYHSCNLSFTINSTESSSGGIITISYSGGDSGSTSTSVSWYTSSSPLAILTSSVTPLNFYANSSESTAITVTNVGNESLSNIQIPSPSITGAGSVSLIGSNTCAGATLAPSESCSYAIVVTASESAQGNVSVGFTSDYDDGGETLQYSNNLAIPYTALDNAPALTIAIPLVNFVGNGQPAEPMVVTITNSGNAPATLSLDGLFGDQANLFTTSDISCVETLAVDASCTIAINLIPIVAESPINITDALYSITYYGGSIPVGNKVTESAPMIGIIQPNNQSMVLESVSVQNSISGDGTTVESSFIFAGYGYGVVSQSITLTYQNTGTNPIVVSGVIDANSGWNYEIDQTSTCIAGSQIAVGQTCTIVYHNILYENYSGLGAGLGLSYTMNLVLPTLVFYDATITPPISQFVVQPLLESPFTGGDTLYVIAKQAMLSSMLTESIGESSVTVANTLSNAEGYNPITVTTQMESYLQLPPVATMNCGDPASESGIIFQDCSLSSVAAVGSATYLISQPYLTHILHANYSVNAGGQIISISQLSSQIQLQ